MDKIKCIISSNIEITKSSDSYFIHFPDGLNLYGLSRAEFICVISKYCSIRDMKKCLKFIEIDKAYEE